MPKITVKLLLANEIERVKNQGIHEREKTRFEMLIFLSKKDAKGNPKRMCKKFHGKNGKERALSFRHN